MTFVLYVIACALIAAVILSVFGAVILAFLTMTYMVVSDMKSKIALTSYWVSLAIISIFVIRMIFVYWDAIFFWTISVVTKIASFITGYTP